MGHPIGFPHQINQQLRVLRHLLKYLKTIKKTRTLVEVDLTDPEEPGQAG